MSDGAHQEIVIIRRGGHGDHDEHHGGVWKIAFADFMTAMMAFFLVMWLISANDKTRASVARYFNPVRLVDATTQPRGLHDSKKDESGITASPETKRSEDKQGKPETTSKDGKDGAAGKADKATSKADKEAPAARDRRLDVALRENPYVALAEIVATKPPAGDPVAVATPAAGQRGGDAFRDPFAPPPPPLPGDSGGKTDIATSAKEPTDTRDSKAAPPPTTAAADPLAQAKKDEVKTVLTALKPQGIGNDGPQVDVRRTSEGLLVSFTDTSTFAMFANGSAVPARKLVLLMEHVAKLLKTHPGELIVRGFTDNKPYRSGRYDNWHLSLDRAQVTHYMLVRGGFEDARIGHVEGYADRGKIPGADPSSALNRRIEILLKDPT